MSTTPTTPAAAPAVPAAPAAPAASLDSLLPDELASVPWYRSRWIWAGVALLILAVLGFFWWQNKQRANAAPSYATQPVARGDLTLSVVANGTLQPTRSFTVGSELSGTVRKVNADVNDKVNKGDVLLELDTAKLRDQVHRSEANLAAAEAKLAQTAATVKEARASLDRLEEVARLSGGKVPSKAELDSSRATLDRALADNASARAGVADSKAALSTDRTNLGKAAIVAPGNGTVLTRSVEPGNAVAATLQAVTLMTIAEDLSKLRLWVYVDEADVGSVKLGQDATFTVSAFLNRTFPARVTRVGYGSTITDNVVTYLTYLDVDNADLSLRPGMTATATITAKQRKDVLLVPNTALRFTPTADNGPKSKGGPALTMMPRMPPSGNNRRSAASTASTALARQVWVLPEGGGAPVAVAVTPGISDGHQTEIVSGDLKPGMQVITAQKSAGAL